MVNRSWQASNGLWYPVRDHDEICPKCGQEPIYYHVRSNHWAVCEECKVRWYYGSGLMSIWMEFTEDDFQKNAKFLSGLEERDNIYKTNLISEGDLEILNKIRKETGNHQMPISYFDGLEHPCDNPDHINNFEANW
jgi:ssDNA-binding Zn-finger/Zn-ribbon topoisomerase 1